MDVAQSPQRAGRGARADINVTPLIDIVLVMLIIFMVLTPSFLKHLTATVPSLPHGAQPDAVLPPITLEFSAQRRIALNGQVVAAAQLPQEVAARLRFDKRKLVFFDIDDACAYGDVIKLMDTVRGAGARVLGVVTKAKID